MKKCLLAVCVLMAWPAAAIAQKGVSPYPVYANGGLPDLVVDAGRLTGSIDVVNLTFSSTSCEMQEGSIGAPGTRKLLRFDVAVVNGGNGHLVVGNPADPSNPYAEFFQYSPCHRHYHLEGFTDYELLRLDASVAAAGHKQAFCLMDILRYGTGPSQGYNCSNQGISSGWADLYSKNLSGQWVDITGVPDGNYVLYVKVNAAGMFAEGQNVYSDVVQVPIHLPRTSSK